MPAPLRAAALPAYMPAGFADAPFGHRFLLYFKYWQAEKFAPYKDSKSDPNLGREDKKRIQEEIDRQRAAIMREVCEASPVAIELTARLRKRQQALAEASVESWSIAAISTAPFATGLGNEHPVENGFAFLTPYGLPYLAGSGVKGVLRRAAEELALFGEPETGEPAGITMLDVWWLFGFEGAAGAWWPLTGKEERELNDEQKARRAEWKAHFDADMRTLTERDDLHEFIRRAYADDKTRAPLPSETRKFLEGPERYRKDLHLRGALDFWDVFPQPPREGPYKDRLAVEIMTPHYGDYYQGKSTPHDAGQPNPIPFLAVPAGSAFDFHVACDPTRLPTPLAEKWRALLEGIFHHAFDWLGFGAKTAVGYGAMKPLEPGEVAARRAAEAQATLRCDWVDQTLHELAQKNRASESDTLRGKGLAEVWSALTDPALKARALADIRARWQAEGWWETPPSGAAKKARAIYDAAP